jgi:gluconokinase
VTARVIIIMGVTGSGKTTVARALADHLGWRFCDADDLHSPENIERMRRGVGLDDERRGPWLLAVRGAIDNAVARQEPIVVACSALKEQYRATLSDGLAGVRFVHLTAPEAVLRERLQRRPNHFAGVSLLASQCAALEPPVRALTLDATQPVDRLVELIVDDLSRAAKD